MQRVHTHYEYYCGMRSPELNPEALTQALQRMENVVV